MKILKIILLLLIFFLSFPLLVKSASAASLKFDKTTVSVANGGTFQIAVTVDPGGEALNSVDAYVLFDATVLKTTAVTAGSLFPTVFHDESTTGKIYIAGLVNDPANSISTSGILATITFQALKDGAVTLSFDCSSSKIIKNDINASNIMNCSTNGSSAVTVGGTAAPTQLPESGIFDNVVKFAVPGMILLFMGGMLRFIL